jgi:phosphopentomutase
MLTLSAITKSSVAALIIFLLALAVNHSQNYQFMFPNLLEATKEYWHKLDRLEAAYQQGEIPLEEVDTRVAELMTEMAQKRRAAFSYCWQGWQY